MRRSCSRLHYYDSPHVSANNLLGDRFLETTVSDQQINIHNLRQILIVVLVDRSKIVLYFIAVSAHKY
jgi:hypothetical protein